MRDEQLETAAFLAIEARLGRVTRYDRLIFPGWNGTR